MTKCYNKALCNYILSKQQDELLIVFENFCDNISDPENNTFFVQNAIIDKMLDNLSKCKRKTISKEMLYKGISELEMITISSLNLEEQIEHNANHADTLGIDYFDEKKFMNTLDDTLEEIATKYNLNADDDYNKLYMFVSSLQMTLEISDDRVHTLINLYMFYHEHSEYSINELEDEYITIYDEKYYKFDLLKQIIDSYKLALKQETMNISDKNTSKR